ncbi:hypothetical protein OPU71_10145 [Niveibacterium sp. 24ML]|uniref:hypothetical protein n=1 Tax=Niveibacterium sp. 24ML TaxID=2985512 RepID=UPI00226F0799|nr:hypothetical protein [Niveibacterium sp. 24ML]MCX9156481.1 hypothetical protein [Niveibacterium sp. 24ML]
MKRIAGFLLTLFSISAHAAGLPVFRIDANELYTINRLGAAFEQSFVVFDMNRMPAALRAAVAVGESSQRSAGKVFLAVAPGDEDKSLVIERLIRISAGDPNLEVIRLAAQGKSYVWLRSSAATQKTLSETLSSLDIQFP